MPTIAQALSCACVDYCDLEVESLYLFTLYRFLVEGDKGAVLHTGDFRAEPCFLDSISRNPFLQRYLVQPARKPEYPVRAHSTATLEAIYLDTASLLSKLDAPSKVRNTSNGDSKR